MNRRDVDQTLPWMGAGTEYLLRTVHSLPDDALAAPSALPGWTRAHVVGHLARNAEALTRLATWARTGVETPMYADAEQRAKDIESSAHGSVETLRVELDTTAADLDSALAALDGDGWRAEVRSALGRTIPATEVPWMRVREVWLHAVDLDAGATVADFPEGVVDTLLDDVTGTLSGRDGCPAALLAPTDREQTWTLGAEDGPEIRGGAAQILAWLTGRSAGTDLAGALPTPPRWI
jgi:maleylpyruvate isomerase